MVFLRGLFVLEKFSILWVPFKVTAKTHSIVGKRTIDHRDIKVQTLGMTTEKKVLQNHP